MNSSIKIVAIATMSKNRVIGKNNSMPWHLSADLKRFRKITTGGVVIMGRKTFESIGRVLPNRTSIIVTRNKEYNFPKGVIVAESLEDGIRLGMEVVRSQQIKDNQEMLDKKETQLKPQTSKLFIIGGAEIYNQAIEKDYLDEIYLTVIDREYDGDATFPQVDSSKYKLVESEMLEEEGVKYENRIYVRQ